MTVLMIGLRQLLNERWQNQVVAVLFPSQMNAAMALGWLTDVITLSEAAHDGGPSTDWITQTTLPRSGEEDRTDAVCVIQSVDGPPSCAASDNDVC